MAVLEGTLRVLIIDHYDSYTNNILQLLQDTSSTVDGEAYPQWSAAVVRFDQYSWEHFRDTILPALDAIILSPGPGRPDRVTDFGFNTTLIRHAKIPILGICLGHQGIGTSFGAKIIHAPTIKHGQVSAITHTDAGILRGLPQGFDAVRYNSLVLDPEDIPSDLEVTAWTLDPSSPTKKVLMGIQHRSRPIYGVQWHPESICSAQGRALLSNFRDIALEYWSSRQPVRVGASLSENLLSQSAIAIAKAPSEAPAAPLPPQGETQRPYYVAIETLGRGPQPQHVYEAFIRGTSSDGEAWLDSAKVRDVHSRNSYMASAAFAQSYSTSTRILSFHQNGKIVKSTPLEDTTYWAWLSAFQTTIQTHTTPLPASALGQPTAPGQPILQVGLIGYFGYELKRESLPGYSYTPPSTSHPDTPQATPDAQLLFADRVLWLDNYTQTWHAVGLVRRGEYDPLAVATGASSVGLTATAFEAWTSDLRAGFANPILPSPAQPVPIPSFSTSDTEESYSTLIAAARAAIREGESYELTLTTKFRSQSSADPYALYLSLRARNPAPYSAFLNFAASDVAVLSSSPERFISIDRQGVAEMKPIKGTVAVSADEEEDRRRVDRLGSDVKELAENLMIVDLIRADLHNISPPSSITVPKLLKVESYETVHQLVTTIQSHIPLTVPTPTALSHIFPPGSMTGAPKLRSVQILDSLERHAPRGIYSGCLGYLCVSGTADQSVVIRTIVKSGRELELGAGGAVTWLSEPKAEWEEVLVKANAVAEAGMDSEDRVRFDSLEPLGGGAIPVELEAREGER
ncbi:ADC synthase [Trichodelitschia bisporula]|uniref:aminodeoxychorismate synthase n=1 Tax=Trichodelitschia bisporula TaxID=703511 RepID=A0A6G1I3Y2_9PEZI|nr:ADC synthase [Trichodelitschia bisporula]